MHSKLIIIDGNAIMHRAFHAIPPLSTPTGEPINAVHGFVSMLLRVVQDLKPTHIAVCFDQKEPTFRKKLLPSYQEQRPEMASELSSQFEKVYKFLDASKIKIYGLSGYEADDVIGTLTETLNPKSEILIITGDRDILQLVDDKRNIKLFMPIGGLANGQIFTEKETLVRMEVVPSQIPDLKSLIGDPSDNYKGVAGIGPKTAQTLLSKYKSKENIYKSLNEIPEKIREKLINGSKDCDMSYKLATIVRDVPVKFNFDDMNKWDLGNSNIIKLFEQEFGFKTLTERVKKLNSEKQLQLI